MLASDHWHIESTSTLSSAKVHTDTCLVAQTSTTHCAVPSKGILQRETTCLIMCKTIQTQFRCDRCQKVIKGVREREDEEPLPTPDHHLFPCKKYDYETRRCGKGSIGNQVTYVDIDGDQGWKDACKTCYGGRGVPAIYAEPAVGNLYVG